jgi:hypothetical protein
MPDRLLIFSMLLVDSARCLCMFNINQGGSSKRFWVRMPHAAVLPSWKGCADEVLLLTCRP